MKKRIAGLLAVLVVLTALAGCSYDGKGPGSNKYNLKTVREGYLTVATSPDYAPFEFYTLDENNKPTLAGFDIALAQYIADYLDLTLDIIAMDFNGTISELGTKKCDLSMAGYSPDPERLLYMDFSDIYYTSEQAFVTIRSKASNFTDLASANNSKTKIGVQIGSIQAELAKKYAPDADIIELSKVTNVIADLTTGNLDGAFIEAPVLQAYMNNYPELQIVCTVPYEDNGSVLGVSKGNAELLKYVNEAIAASKADGSFQRFVAEAVELAFGKTQKAVPDKNKD